MATAESFLINGDVTDYDVPGRRFERRIVERYPRSGTLSGTLTGELISTVQLHRKDTVEDGYWFEAVCIQVRKGDGMTWAAETARRDLDKAFPNFRTHTLTDELTADGLPSIAGIAGEDFLVRAAVRAKLTRPFVSLDSRHGLINFAIVVMIAALTQVFTILLKKSGDSTDAFFSSSFYLSLVGYALLAALAQWVLATRFFKRDDAIARLIANLQDETRARQTGRLVEAAAEHLARDSRPRFVIVDGFARLDDFSQKVITTYFDRYATRHAASEMWTILESDDAAVFGALVPRRNGVGGFNSTRLYDQELLSASERSALAEKIGAPERATLATVKQICSFTGGDVEFVETWFRAYVERNGAPRRNALTYFYLLALEQPDLLPSQRQPIGGQLVFPWPWLEKLSSGEASDSTVQVQSLAAQKQTALAKIAAQFFGAPLRVEEIVAFSSEIQRDFERFVVYSDTRTKARFHVERQTAEWLAAHARELKLPSASIGKLFWALAQANAKPNDGAWMRRAMRNLLEVDAGAIPEDIRGELYPQVRDLYFRLIESSIRRSRFQDVPELIEAAVNAVVFLDPDKTPQLMALREHAWQVYLISGSDAALRALLAIGEALGETEDDVTAGRFLHTFAQTCSLTPGGRAVLEAQLAGATGSALAVAHDHAVAIASWCVAAGAPFVYARSTAKEAHLLFDLDGVLPALDATIDRVAARIAESAGSYVLDVATLSTAAWSLVLLQADGLPILGPTDDSVEIARGARLAEIVAAAEKVVIAAGLYVRKSNKPGTPNFLGEAMTYDACAAALAAARTALCIQQRAAGAVEVPANATQQRIIDSVNEILGTNIAPQAAGDAFVISETEKLLHAAAMTWQRFGLERLTHLANIRRVAFSFRTRDIGAADYDAHEPLVQSLSPVLRETNVSGLLANLTLAQCFRGSSSMMAYYLTAAAELALAGDFGEELQSALMLVAVIHPSQKTAPQAEELLSRLLDDTDGRAILPCFLDNVPDDEVSTSILELDILLRHLDSPETTLRLEETIRTRASNAQPGKGKDELLGLLAFRDLQKEEKNGKLDPDRVMKEWAERRELWTYSSVLRLLLDAPRGPSLVRPEAERLLRRDAAGDANNGWYLLAMRLANNLLANNLPIDIPIRYLREAVPLWESRHPEETNLETYHLLARLDIAHRPRHRVRLAYWQSIIIERDHLQLLPELARRGRFFLIFSDYVNHMWSWGLGIDIADAELYRRRNLPMQERAAVAAEWRKNGARVSQALRQNAEGSTCVSGEFLLTGELLFKPPVEKDSDFDQDRLRFDEEARRNLPRLIDEIRRLQTLPTSIRNLIAHYAKDYS
jgi:hypothetical protein